MLSFLLPMALLAACEPQPAPVVDPDHALASVCTALEDAGAHADAKSWENAVAAFAMAHRNFDEALEPLLRERLPARQVLAVEYDWAIAQTELAKHRSDTGGTLRALASTLRDNGS